jgi:hypothetical protein
MGSMFVDISSEALVECLLFEKEVFHEMATIMR